MFKKALLLVLSVYFGNALAQEAMWSKTFARIYVLKTERVLQASTINYHSGWASAAQQMSEILGIPVTKLSPEYLAMKLGHMVLGKTEYSDSFDFPEPNQEIENLLERSQTEQLSFEDFKGPQWLHLLKPIDDEEEACLWAGNANGKWTGCGDVWQGGLTEDKVVCFENKTYLKCHIDCMKKIYHRENEINVQPGFCPEVAQ